MSSNVAVVICQGFFHNVSIYQPSIEALKSRGIDAYCPQLPTSDLSRLNVGDLDCPNFDLDPPPEGYPQGEEDTEAVLGVLRPLIERQNKQVLLLAHSAGGWVATQAAIPELLETSRQSQGLSGGLIGIFYFGAFVVPLGESLHTTFQPKDGRIVTPPWLQFHVSLRLDPRVVDQYTESIFHIEKWSGRRRNTVRAREVPLQRIGARTSKEVGTFTYCVPNVHDETYQ